MSGCTFPPARSVIEQVRSSQPARQVGGGSRNVSGRYPSRKMGFTIQFESHRVELAGIYEMEHDHSVLEFYDQPPSIKLDYFSAAGRRLTVMHTPDFFLIRQDAAGWEEWKTEEELVRLAQRNPHRYLLEGGLLEMSAGRGIRSLAGAVLPRALFPGDQLGLSKKHSIS